VFDGVLSDLAVTASEVMEQWQDADVYISVCLKLTFDDGCYAGVTVVLKFLKFQNCPEIVLKLQIVLKFRHLV